MTVEQKYGQTTSGGCNSTLNAIQSLDENITVGEINKFLTKRKEDAFNQATKEKSDLIEATKGKVVRIQFDEEHVTILNITDVRVFHQFGDVDAELRGESITHYKGHLRYEDKIDGNYSSYFPNQSLTDFNLKQFKSLKRTIQKLQTI